MAHSRVAIGLAAVAAACLGACGRDVRPGADTTGARVSMPDSLQVSGTWPGELGATLIVPSDTESLAVVLYPVREIGRTVTDSGVALVSSGGDIVRRRVGLSVEDTLHCGDAPLARLARTTPPTWAVGIESGAAPLRVDSMDTMGDADSTPYSAELLRLASSIGAQRTSRFTGLPFTIATVRRFMIAGREVVVAQVVRRLNQEAEPLEERSLVVAERPSDAKGPFTMVHGDRADGPEESAAHFDLLSAIRTPRSVFVILAREKETGTTFDILERDSSGMWTVKWSRTIGC
jgi:hypothetical protein